MDSKLPIDILDNVMQLAIEGCKAVANYMREVRTCVHIAINHRNTHLFFNKKPVNEHGFEYELKSREQYSQENNKNELPRKKYFPQTTLKDIVLMLNQGKPILSKEEERRRAALYADNQAYNINQENERKKG